MELSSLIFQKVTFRAQKMKKTHSEKTSYISRNGTFQPQALKTSYISKGNLQSLKIKQKICPKDMKSLTLTTVSRKRMLTFGKS